MFKLHVDSPIIFLVIVYKHTGRQTDTHGQSDMSTL